MRSNPVILSVLGLACGLPSFGSVSFNVTYSTSTFGSESVTAVENAVAYVTNEYQNLFTNNVVVNVTVQGGTGGLGSSNTSLVGFASYAQTRAALEADYTANPDANTDAAAASLPSTDPTSGGLFVFATAEAKALGLIGPSSSTDGTITFNNAASYTFDPNNRDVAGEFDFIGVMEHEFSEVMGRIPILGTNFGSGASYDPNDLFRFTAPGTRSLTQTDTGVYLSLNDGTTSLAGFNSNSSGDLDDYNGTNPSDPYNAFTSSGQGHALTAADIANMEAIGWDAAAATSPEPATLATVGLALLGGGLLRRRVKARS